ncbi:Calcineurin-like metallo-phosphoesterase superfamily protein [Prunus dulcis]|uniref:Calcineurin-like metallo-phosphoesterase superfamily protein n=1 Tax=Prunus dulcis TaxID=3755 RepID=A0A4Y1RW91_PRUDU|nr:Calcineurin-like metallo-phosphoesterase superfamily protein [Prunus dulcis]
MDNVRAHHVQRRFINNTNTTVELDPCHRLRRSFRSPQKPMYHGTSGTRPLDLYFISVGGGFRPLNQQTHLLKQMEKVVKKYKAEFVVDISDLGKDDPLMQNGTLLFSSLKLPGMNSSTCRYTTRVSERHGGGYFQKKINLPYEKTLDVIVVDTGLLQGTGSLGGFGNNQLHWLKRTLETTSTITNLPMSNWLVLPYRRIVVGFHPLAICEDGEEGMGEKKVFESLQLIFMKFEVNAYLSAQGCASSVRRHSLSYLGNPGQMEDGFLLHRVSTLEIVTYFVSSGGELVHKSVLHQRGKEIM